MRHWWCCVVATGIAGSAVAAHVEEVALSFVCTLAQRLALLVSQK